MWKETLLILFSISFCKSQFQVIPETESPTEQCNTLPTCNGYGCQDPCTHNGVDICDYESTTALVEQYIMCDTTDLTFLLSNRIMRCTYEGLLRTFSSINLCNGQGFIHEVSNNTVENSIC